MLGESDGQGPAGNQLQHLDVVTAWAGVLWKRSGQKSYVFCTAILERVLTSTRQSLLGARLVQLESIIHGMEACALLKGNEYQWHELETSEK